MNNIIQATKNILTTDVGFIRFKSHNRMLDKVFFWVGTATQVKIKISRTYSFLLLSLWKAKTTANVIR